MICVAALNLSFVKVFHSVSVDNIFDLYIRFALLDSFLHDGQLYIFYPPPDNSRRSYVYRCAFLNITMLISQPAQRRPTKNIQRLRRRVNLKSAHPSTNVQRVKMRNMGYMFDPSLL